MHPERITEKDKELVNDINYDGNDFPMVEKIFSKIGTKNNICINVSCHEIKLTFHLHLRSKIWKFNRFLAYNWWK